MKAAWLIVTVVAACAGCGRDYAMRCEDPERYAGERQAPPVKVPGDLDVPDESEALHIPPARRAEDGERNARRGPCLESPPSYYGAAGAPEDSPSSPEENGSETPD